MKRTKGNVFYAVIGALGATAAILPLAIYHLVETAGSGGMHGMHGMEMSMKCEAACTAEAIVGTVIAVIAIASLFVKNQKLSVASSAALLVGGVAAIAVPRVIGFCETVDMACRYITAPTLAIIGSAIIVLALARIVSDLLALRKRATV